jgi:hypothetical protein
MGARFHEWGEGAGGEHGVRSEPGFTDEERRAAERGERKTWKP